MIPPMSQIDISSYPEKSVSEVDKPMNKIGQFQIQNFQKCKYHLPCGRCELTKELCTYNYIGEKHERR